MKHSRQRVASTCVLALVGVLLSVFVANTAQAVSYRYWTYWNGTTQAWTFSQVGPAGNIPKDGAVEGWKFAVSTQSGDDKARPDFDATTAFDAICSSTPAQLNKKRVALVIDPGVASDAPAGESPGQLTSTCVQAELNATGYNVLRSVTEVRTSNGLICGIGGYPATECADVVDEASTAMAPSTQQSPTQDTSSSPIPVVIVMLILGIGGGFMWQFRKRT